MTIKQYKPKTLAWIIPAILTVMIPSSIGNMNIKQGDSVNTSLHIKQTQERKEPSELIPKIIEHARTNWKKNKINNVAGKYCADQHYFDTEDYHISIVTKTNGNVECVGYEDKDLCVLDLADNGWGINHHLDGYIDVATGFKIDEDSSSNDMKRANNRYAALLEKVYSDNL